MPDTKDLEDLKEQLTNALIQFARKGELDKLQELTSAAKVLEIEERALAATKAKIAALLDNGSTESPAQDAGVANNDRGKGTIETKKSEFPRFFVEEDVLIKEALRSDGHTVYVQRMPQATFLEILKSLREILTSKREFHVPEVSELSDSPAYQVYMALSVLQEEGLLEVVRRGRYRFVESQEAPWAARMWAKLSTRGRV